MENHFSRYAKLTLCVLVFILSISLSLGTGHGQDFNRRGGLKAWLAERSIDHAQFRERLREAIKVQNKHTPGFMEMPGVEGTAAGVRADGEPIIKIFTSRAGIIGIPDRLDGFPVQVEVTGSFVAYYDYENPRTTLPRPVPIGASTGHPAITAGTIGARVKGDLNGDGIDEVYALSNNHVYADMNNANIGDNVLQAGPIDGGINPDDKIGTLFDYEPLLFDGSNNTIDAAIALSSRDELRNNTPLNPVLWEQFTPSEEIVDPFIGQQVKKFGRTTELTYGAVAEINVTVNVCYEYLWGIFCVKSARFVNQIAITPGTFSGGGDSGSLIVTTEGNNPVGLLFAGSDTRTLANPIGPVLSKFGVTVDGESAEPFTDISIESVTAPASVIEGDKVDVDVVVANVGNQNVTNDITVTLKDELDPSFEESQTISDGLTAGASTTLTFSWNATSLGDHQLKASHGFVDDDSTNDYASTEVINVVDSLTDVALTGVSAPSSVAEGDSVNVEVTVQNVGNQDVGTFGVTLTDITDGDTIGTQMVFGLAVGASITLTYTWDTTDNSEGIHTLRGSHDLSDDDTGNNSKTAAVNVVMSLTDVAVTAVNAPSSVTEGNTASVEVTVENIGNQDVEDSFQVTLKDMTTTSDIGNQTVFGLAAGASTTLTYSWNTTGASIGDHTLEGSHDLPDDDHTNDSKTTSVEIKEQTSAGPHLWIGKKTVSTAEWETVLLDNDYDYGSKMVVVCTPNYTYHYLSMPEPLVAQVQNASGSSFQVKLVQAVGGSIQDVSADVHCMVAEEGVYNVADHGVKMEAVKFPSTLTDWGGKNKRTSSWIGENRSYFNWYTNPVVVGQVMSANSYDCDPLLGCFDELWTAFWCRGSSIGSPPSRDALYIGKHKGEDFLFERDNETIGYVVVEAGTGSIGTTNYVAGLGPSTIQGVGNNPPYNYSVGTISDPANAVAILSQAGMNGINGGWAILYDDNPITASGIKLAIDEDMALDSERKHTAEQVGYIVFE